MKMKLFNILLVFCSIGLLMGCDDWTNSKAIDIHKPYTYSDQYYENLRAYKVSDHAISYGWFADYGQSTSLGQRFLGLPDSLDICSLWSGIPSLKQNDSLTSYNPVAYNEMRYVRQMKGIKMVVPTIIRIAYFPQFKKDSAGVNAFADYLVKMVLDNDLDGADLDYEPEGDWLTGDKLTWLVKRMGEKLGPKSNNPDKLLIVDFYGSTPPAGTEPYVSFYVRQAYNASSASTLQSGFNAISSWCSSRKYIVTENIGDNWKNGGVAFTEANGNNLRNDGTQLYSLEGMARWNPTQGRKGGFGAFYIQRDYYLDPPYKNVRCAIQMQNTAVK